VPRWVPSSLAVNATKPAFQVCTRTSYTTVSCKGRKGDEIRNPVALQGEVVPSERSLTEGMDTTTASGELLFHVFGALAQYERAMTKERVVTGLAAARRRGRIGGRPPAITGEKLEAIIGALHEGMSKAAVCRNFAVYGGGGCRATKL
jgi:hypothetical protein